MSLLSTLLSLFAATLFGAGDFCGGLAVRKAGLRPSLLLSQAAGALLLLALASLQGGIGLSPADLPLALVSGLCAAAGLAILYRGLATGVVAVVAPVSAVLAALVPAFLGAARGETPSASALAGAGLCLPALALLSWEREGDGNENGASVRHSLLAGSLAGILLGAFYAGIALMRTEAGLWPLFAARLVSMAAIGLFVALGSLLASGRVRGFAPGSEEDFPVDIGEEEEEALEAARARAKGKRQGLGALAGGGLVAALASGALDASGNAAFLAASREGPLMLVSVLTSLYPALTVILARLFFGQHLGRRRAAGLALALVGVALISQR
jgi:drug/metabolite transporter (DMT)-like permease